MYIEILGMSIDQTVLIGGGALLATILFIGGFIGFACHQWNKDLTHKN